MGYRTGLQPGGLGGAGGIRSCEDRIMKLSDDVLMAYARGQLDGQERSEVERAMRADPAVAARVARHRALRAHAYQVYGAVLNDPPPPRPAPVGGKVVQLDAVRAARQQGQQGQPGQHPPPARAPWTWHKWTVLAAALAIGALEGVFAYSLMQGEPGITGFDGKAGALVAQGPLAKALSHQLSGGEGNVRIGVSFMATDGSYCRGFMFGGAGGLACHMGERWHIAALAEIGADNQLPKPVRDVIAERINGAALDVQGERNALEQGWRR
jgi:hypothetical protein